MATKTEVQDLERKKAELQAQIAEYGQTVSQLSAEREAALAAAEKAKAEALALVAEPMDTLPLKRVLETLLEGLQIYEAVPALPYVTTALQRDREELTVEVKALQEERAALTADLAPLRVERDRIAADVAALKVERAQVADELRCVQAERDRILAKIREFHGEGG